MPKVFGLLPRRLVGYFAFSQMRVGFGEEEEDEERATASKSCLEPEDHSP